MLKKLPGYAATFIAGAILAGGTAYAATNYVEAQQANSMTVVNGQVVSNEPALVYGGTTYFPLWYVQNALNKMNIHNTWNGFTFTADGNASTSPDSANTGQEISQVMEHTRTGQYGAPFLPKWNTEVTTSDGYGGTLTAIVGQNADTFYGDGYGQAVFIFHNGQFVTYGGTNEQNQIVSLTASNNEIHVIYPDYEQGDPISRPSGQQIDSYYYWSGSQISGYGGNPQQSQGPKLYYNTSW